MSSCCGIWDLKQLHVCISMYVQIGTLPEITHYDGLLIIFPPGQNYSCSPGSPGSHMYEAQRVPSPSPPNKRGGVHQGPSSRDSQSWLQHARRWRPERAASVEVSHAASRMWRGAAAHVTPPLHICVFSFTPVRVRGKKRQIVPADTGFPPSTPLHHHQQQQQLIARRHAHDVRVATPTPCMHLACCLLPIKPGYRGQSVPYRSEPKRPTPSYNQRPSRTPPLRPQVRNSEVLKVRRK